MGLFLALFPLSGSAPLLQAQQAMASHTTTGEWKSFEVRMRRRRVERLLVRVEVALQEGCIDQARATLDEARRLAPGLAALEALQRRIDAPAAPATADRRRRLLRLAIPLVAGAAMIALAAGISAARRTTMTPAQDLRALPMEAPAAPERNPISPVVQPAAETHDAGVRLESPPTIDLVERRPPEPRSTPAVTPVSLISKAPGTRTTVAADLPVSSPAVDPPVTADTSAPLPIDVAPAAAVTPPPPPAERVADVEAGVRGTLSRYAAAYSTLDADAAQRVWPQVNHAALTRAFDALASQQISLGDCRIDVNGAVARAACAGSATWAAKVGDGSPRTEPRHWNFDLTRSGDGWEIVSAHVQNK